MNCIWGRVNQTWGRNVRGRNGLGTKWFGDEVTRFLQKRSLCMISFADRRAHAIPLFLEAKILPITFLYHESVSSLTHDISSNKAPLNILCLFEKTSKIHSYNTRSSTSENFYVNSFRLEIQQRSFSRRGGKVVE